MSNCKRVSSFAIVLTATLLLNLPTHAELPYEVLGAGFTGRPIVVTGDIVLETDGYMEAIRDFSDPESPRWIGWNYHGASITWSRVFVDGDLVVGLNDNFADGTIGFNVTDFARPDAPVELSVTGSIVAESGWLGGGALFLAGENLAAVYDLTDLTAPAIATVLVVGNHVGNRWPTEAGGRLFLIDSGSTLRRLELSDPVHPIDLGTLPPLAERVEALAGAGDVLYLLLAGAGAETYVDLVAWDVGGDEPIETARHRLSTSDGASGRTLVLDGDLLLAGAGDERVQAFGLTTPTHPDPGWSLPHDASRVVLSDHAIFVLADDTLLVYPRSAADLAPADPVRRPIPPAMDAVFGEGPRQVAQSRSDRSLLIPIDASDPTHPSVGTPIDTGLDGTFRYADGIGLMDKGESGFQLLDCSDPWAPRPAATVPRPTAEADAGVHAGGVMLVRYQTTRSMLDIWNVADPDQPRRAASIAEQDIRYCDGRWLICGLNDLERPRVYSLDENLQPVLVSRLMTNLLVTYRFLVVDGYVYAYGPSFDDRPMMEVHELGENSTVVLERELESWQHREDLFQGLVFMQGNFDCMVFDVSDPASPQQIGTFPNPMGLSYPSFAVNGDVVTLSSGLITVRVTTSAASVDPAPSVSRGVRLGPARPNPFNPRTSISFALDREQDLTVAVYDARGRLVDELVRGHFEEGEHTLVWDARSGGAPVASGVYFVRLHGPGVEAVQAVTMLK